MADTFTASLRFQVPTIGADGNNVWPTVLNADLGLTDTAITGVSFVSIAGLTTYTLTANDGQPDQARALLQQYTGALTGDCTVTLPASVKIGWAQNLTSGSHGVILTTGSGTTLELIDAGWTFFYCDGTNVAAPIMSFRNGVRVTGGLITDTGQSFGVFSVAPGVSSGDAVNLSQFAGAQGIPGFNTLPNGNAEKWGTGAVTGGSGSVTFAAPFANAVDNIQLTITGATGPIDVLPLVVGTPTASGFSVFGDPSQNLGFFWFAKGH